MQGKLSWLAGAPSGPRHNGAVTRDVCIPLGIGGGNNMAGGLRNRERW